MNKEQQATEEKELKNETENGQKTIQEKQQALPEEPADAKAKLEELLALERDKYLRLSAEFENFRKRIVKERIEILKYAGGEIILSILPVIDDFERAQQAHPLDEGMQLIYSKLLNMLEKNGLKPMESKGKPFDPELHDALSSMDVADEGMKNKVVDEIEKGYFLGDKVIRHAKVVVGK